MDRPSRLMIRAAILVASLAAPAAIAGPVDGTATVGTYDSQADQILLLQQQKEIEQLKAQIAEARRSQLEASSPGHQAGGSANVVQIGAPAAPPPSPPAPKRLPLIEAIAQRGAGLAADLRLPNGGEIVAHRGDRLPEGLTVTAVTIEGVAVTSPADGAQQLAFDVGQGWAQSDKPPEATPGAAPAVSAARYIPNLHPVSGTAPTAEPVVPALPLATQLGTRG